MNSRTSRKRRSGCSRNRRRAGQYGSRSMRGGAGEAYTFGASVDPKNPSLGNAAEVIRFPSCENAVRPGTITSYTPTGLPGMRGGRRSRKQRGGRYAFDGWVTPGNGTAVSGVSYTGCGAGADRLAAHPGQSIEGQMSAPLPLTNQRGGSATTQRGGAVPLVGAAVDAGGALLQGVGGAVGGILGTSTHIAGQGAATALGTAGGVLGSGLSSVGSGIRDGSAYAGSQFASGAARVAGTFRGGRRKGRRGQRGGSATTQRGGGAFPGADIASTGVGLLGSGLTTVGQGVGNILGTSAQVVGNTTGNILTTSGQVLGSGLQTVGTGISSTSGAAANTVSAAASRAAEMFIKPMRGGYVAPVGQTGTLPVDAMVYQAPRSGWAVMANTNNQPGSGVYSINVPYGSAPQVSSSCKMTGGRRSRRSSPSSRRNTRKNRKSRRNSRSRRN